MHRANGRGSRRFVRNQTYPRLCWQCCGFHYHFCCLFDLGRHGHSRLNRSEQGAASICNLPAIDVAQHERLAEDIEAGGMHGQAFRSIGPVGAARNQNCDSVLEIRQRHAPVGMSRQNL